MKKRILLKTLIPLMAMGVGLGVALPLVSCSPNINDNDVTILYNMPEAINYINTTINAALTTSEDINKDWSATPVGDSTMIAWFNEKITVSVYAAIQMGSYVFADRVVYPIVYEHNSDDNIAFFSFEQVNPYGSCFLSVSRSSNTFHAIWIDGTPHYDGDFALLKAGTTSKGDRLIMTSSFQCDISFSVSYWPSVKFPTADPK